MQKPLETLNMTHMEFKETAKKLYMYEIFMAAQYSFFMYICKMLLPDDLEIR